MSKLELIGASVAMSNMSMAQMHPRDTHKWISQRLAHNIADALQQKIADLYEIRPNGTLGAQYPAFKKVYELSFAEVTYGVEFHVLSRQELKAAIDRATEDLKMQHQIDLAALKATQKAAVKEEAKRLLDKAAL